MVFTAAQNARVFQTDQLAHIMWSMAKLGAQPCVEVMDTIMYAMYQTIDASHLQVTGRTRGPAQRFSLCAEAC